jgi:hypothetical protein
VAEWGHGLPQAGHQEPEDFAAMAKLVRPEDFKNRVLISSDLEEHVAHVQKYLDMGFDEIHLHNVGRNQAEFIETFGARGAAESAARDAERGHEPRRELSAI